MHRSRRGTSAARDLAETVAYLGLICGCLAKLATDIILLAQTGVGEVSEPYVAGRGAFVDDAAKSVTRSRPSIFWRRREQCRRWCLSCWERWRRTTSAPLAHGRAGAGSACRPSVLTHGALLHARAIAGGMVVDPQRMRQDLDLTHGLIVAEAVMMGLAPFLGRRRGASRGKACLRYRARGAFVAGRCVWRVIRRWHRDSIGRRSSRR